MRTRSERGMRCAWRFCTRLQGSCDVCVCVWGGGACVWRVCIVACVRVCVRVCACVYAPRAMHCVFASVFACITKHCALCPCSGRCVVTRVCDASFASNCVCVTAQVSEKDDAKVGADVSLQIRSAFLRPCTSQRALRHPGTKRMRQVRQTQNVDVDVCVGVESHPVGVQYTTESSNFFQECFSPSTEIRPVHQIEGKSSTVFC